MKKLNLLILALSLPLFFVASAFIQAEAQSNVKFTEPKKVQADATVQEEKPFKYVNQMPEFEGGQAAFMKFMTVNLKYPASGAEGTTVTSFIVEKDGTLSNIKVLSSASAAMDKEATRVIGLTSGKWKPGKQNGRIVRVELIQPIEFTASKE